MRSILNCTNKCNNIKAHLILNKYKCLKVLNYEMLVVIKKHREIKIAPLNKNMHNLMLTLKFKFI